MTDPIINFVHFPPTDLPLKIALNNFSEDMAIPREAHPEGWDFSAGFLCKIHGELYLYSIFGPIAITSSQETVK